MFGIRPYVTDRTSLGSGKGLAHEKDFENGARTKDNWQIGAKLAQNWRMKNDFEMRASFSSLVRLLSLQRIFQFFNFFGNFTPSFSLLSLISLLTLIFRDLAPPIKTRRKRMYHQRDHATRKTRKDEGVAGVLANKCHPNYPTIWQVLACFRLYRD